ncbi:MAG: hypothetical protein A3F40_02900 [Chlamydiae bacterium RIFCSPHIGHO2_12_FULL_27_8]|nr:MAG: hypothetical protein A3F40_02900 [Chlamydiae bacterium RIFCSPHIGHO2_12_FULL_27_8]
MDYIYEENTKVELVKTFEKSSFKIPYISSIFSTDFFKKYKECSKYLKNIFADGFQWHDIADIMTLIMNYFSDFSNSSAVERRDSILKVFDLFIDITDTPFLPDAIFDPIFKSIASSLAHLIVPDDPNEFVPDFIFDHEISEDEISLFTNQLLLEFDSTIEFNDISSITKKIIKFINRYDSMSLELKKEASLKIAESVIDSSSSTEIEGVDSKNIIKELTTSFIIQLLK